MLLTLLFALQLVDVVRVCRPRYGYALCNGTVGVYENASRLWRLKAKSQVSCIESFDIDADGVPELITGWTSGKLDARREHNAELVYKDSFAHPVSAIVKADYRMDGREDVIICALDGEVRGYLPADADTRANLLVERPVRCGVRCLFCGFLGRLV